MEMNFSEFLEEGGGECEGSKAQGGRSRRKEGKGRPHCSLCGREEETVCKEKRKKDQPGPCVVQAAVQRT